MVAPYSEPHVWSSFLGPGSGDDDRHRRFVLRVGRSPGRPDGFWHLETPREVETHQLARTSGGLAHAVAFSAAAGGHSGGGAVGQHDDSVLHQQAGRNTLSVAVQTSPGLVGVVRRAPDHNLGGASCRGEQCPSGCSVEGQLLLDRVDPSQADFRVPVAGVGASVCGHVRLGEECPIPGVLLPGIGPPGQQLTMNWDMVHGYAFPPIALIPRVLRKFLRHPSATIVLVAPFWPSQIWFRQLTNLLVDLPRAIPDRWNSETHKFFKEPARLRLTAWRLSAGLSSRRAFQTRWPTLPPRDVVSPLGGFTVPVLHTSQDGVLHEQWIPILPL